MQGDWTYYYDDSQYILTQDASGNLTGTMKANLCSGTSFPITGTTSSGGEFTFTVTGFAACSGRTFLTFTGYLGQPGCNYAYGNWTTSIPSSGGFGQDNPYPTDTTAVFAKPVDVPTSETSKIPTGAQWSTTNGAPWIQTLAGSLAPSEFEGRAVYEYPATGPGNDTCWFKGSTVPLFDAVTTPGFAWNISSANAWGGADFIGWNLAAVKYYRTEKRVPCASTFQQQMVIDAAYSPANPSNYGPYTNSSGSNFYGVPYEVNTLGAGITATTATSTRNGKTSTNTTWK
ncbi:MAG: hypothetical protein WBV69_11345 [Candidatus Sulfotelmatobacter sp.]